MGETEEAIKRAHTQIAAENNAMHSLVSEAGARAGQRLEDVRSAIAEQLNATLQHTIDGVVGRIAAVEGQQHMHSSGSSALGDEVQVMICLLLLCVGVC